MEPKEYLHELLHLPQVWSASLSPDGRWIAFNWYHRHPNMDVFLVPSDGSSPPLALTETPEMTVFSSWTADSRSVVVSEDHDRDEHSRLFLVDLDAPGKMQPLTEDRPPHFINGGSLSPDGRFLYYSTNYDFEKNEVIESSWLYRHDLQSGERKPIAQPDKAAWMVPKLNLQGTYILYNRVDRHPAGMQVYLVDVEGKEDRELFNFGDDHKVFARWFPDGRRILVLSESTDGSPQEHVSLGIYDLQEGKLTWLIDDPQRNIEDATLSPDGLVVVDEIVEATHQAFVLDTQSRAETPFPRLPGNLLPLGRNPGKDWIGLYYSSRRPTELVRFSLDAQQPNDLQSLTHVWEHAKLTEADLVQCESIHWESENALKIQGWLYRASPNSQRVILFIHGGPTAHSEDEMSPELQYFVRRGFNVLDVNYRGSTGFGMPYREMIKEDGWGGREQADIVNGARTLIDYGLAEAGRIGITGTSYGGYSSWFHITHTQRSLIAAAAPICGMTDLVVDYETTRPDLRRYSEEMIGGRPDEIPEKYHERSPIHYVRNIKGKLLIVQGAVDPNVTPENVRKVEVRLNERDIPYEKLVFEDEGHGILKTKNQEVLYERLADFFDAAL